MPSRLLEKRVEILEQHLEGLSELPSRLEAVEGQIVQLRTEMRSEFSAVRVEIRKGDEETRAFMRILHEDTISRIAILAEGHEQTREQVRSLQVGLTTFGEEVVARLAIIDERLAIIDKRLTPRRRKRKA